MTESKPPLEERIAAGMRRHWADPVAGERHRAAVSGPQSEVARARKSAAMKASWRRRRKAAPISGGSGG